MQELIATVERFRGDGGCAWFEAQTHRSLVKYLVEETAELVDAIEAGDEAEMREELGDVLFQVLFHANIAAERGTFTLDDVANEQRDKLVRRNPHVFGPTPTRDIDEIIRMWEEAKAIEKRDRTSVLDGIARSMPALALAEKVLGRGARVDARLAAPLEAGAMRPRPRSATNSWRASSGRAEKGSTPNARCAAQSAASRGASARRSLAELMEPRVALAVQTQRSRVSPLVAKDTLSDESVERTNVDAFSELYLDVSCPRPQLKFGVEVKFAGVLTRPHVDS